MERMIKTAQTHRPAPLWRAFALAPPDKRSLIGALVGTAFYVAFVGLSLTLSDRDPMLPAIAIPGAMAVVFLLRMQLANELGFYALAIPAGVFVYAMNGQAADTALVVVAANLINVALVTGLTRSACGPEPDMRDLKCLMRFVWIAGLIGPLAAAGLGALALGPALGTQTIGSDAFNRFWADSLGMTLIVPSLMLISAAITARVRPDLARLVQSALLLLAGALCTALIFSQDAYSLLILIVPLTLAQAFRHGAVGVALHLLVIAVVASAMTSAGYGPIATSGASLSARLYLMQAFLAANVFTGLPIAAILNGRDRMTTQLADGQRALAVLADSITDAVLQIDAHGVCRYASPSVRTVLRRDPTEFLGHPLQELIREDASERMIDAVQRLLSGETETERFTYRRGEDDAEGAPVFIEADCAIIRDPVSHDRKGLVLSARDVTQRVELEMLLTRARRDAEKAAQAKSDFLAKMSQEIRSPMNGVLGHAERMLRGELDADARAQTEQIVESGRAMMVLLDDILDLAKIEAGQIRIETAPIDLHATLEECVAIHRQTAQQKGLSLHLESGETRPTHAQAKSAQVANTHSVQKVTTDGLRLRQIALNLIGNAVQFTQSGDIWVRCWIEETQLFIEVRDTGIGIDAARLSRIFTPFTDTQNGGAQRVGGTGLSLAISSRLAQCLGGRLTVQSQLGAGSIFTLSLPTQPPSGARQALARKADLADRNSAEGEPRTPPQTGSGMAADAHTQTQPETGTQIGADIEANIGAGTQAEAESRLAPSGEPNLEPPIKAPNAASPASHTARPAGPVDSRSDALSNSILAPLAWRAHETSNDLPPGGRILLVEDHDANRALVAEMLEKFGQYVAIAQDGHEAISMVIDSLLRARPYDLVLMDVQMPGCDGCCATRAIREEGIGPDILPIIALSATGFPEDVEAAYDAGMQGYLAKPLVLADLAHMLQRWLPTRIVETPTDRSVDHAASQTSPDGPITHTTPAATPFEQWLIRRAETIETIRSALASGLIGHHPTQRAIDREERATLIDLVHALAGSAPRFGEAELGEAADRLEQTLRADRSAQDCEARAFELLALADEPHGPPPDKGEEDS